VLLVAAIAFSLLQTMVIPALPELQREFGASTTAVTWVFTVYLLVAAVATPLLGRLGDMFGKRQVLLGVLAALAVGSVVAAVSESLELVIAGRAIQGVGGAVYPLAFGIIRDEFPPTQVGVRISAISAVYGIGAGAGAIMSGPIIDHLGYQWIFWVVLIAVLAAAVAARLFIPDSPVTSPTRIDWPGAILLSLGLVAVLIAVSESGDGGWRAPPVLALFTMGSAVLLAWAWVERRTYAPLIDVGLLRHRGVWTANAVGVLLGIGMFGCLVLIPQLVQTPVESGYGLGVSVTQAGAFLLPAFAMMLIAPLAGAAIRPGDPRALLLTGVVHAAAGCGLLALAHDAAWQIYVCTGLLGGGMGLAWAAMATVLVEAVPQRKVGEATGMNATMRMVGGAVGGQLAAAVVGAGAGPAGIPGETGYTVAFALCSAGFVLAVAVGLFVPVRAGSPGSPSRRR